jgi:hypothetical protein
MQWASIAEKAKAGKDHQQNGFIALKPNALNTHTTPDCALMSDLES